MDWRIRNGTEDDADAVLALWRAAESPRSPTDSEEGIRRLLRRDPEALLLADAGGVVIGSLIAVWDGWRGSLYRLAVDPDWRRQGIGKELVRRGEERLRALGATRLTALVANTDREAVGLWRAVGYERQPGTSRFVRMLG
jgi:ribosomal protein S18 acetylase RimI-like enzyme